MTKRKIGVILLTLTIVVNLLAVAIPFSVKASSNTENSSSYSKIDLSYLLEGRVANQMVGWDATCNVIQTSSNLEDGSGLAKGALIDGLVGSGYTGYQESDAIYAYFSQVSESLEVNQSITLNLQRLHKVDQVSFSSFRIASAGGLPSDFTIEVSADNVVWKTVVTKEGFIPAPDTLTYYFPFDETICQYIRLNVAKIGAAADGTLNVLALTELSAYGKDSKIDLTSNFEGWRLNNDNPTRMNGWDESQNVVKASSSPDDQWGGGGRHRGFLIDGRREPGGWGSEGFVTKGYFTTGNSANTSPNINEWVQINLQSVHTIDRVAFYGISQTSLDEGIPIDFTIEVSKTGLDGSWSVVVEKTNNVPAAKYEYTFDPVEAQYVRLHVTKVNSVLTAICGTYEVVLSEFEIYEHWDVDITPPPPFTGKNIAANNENIRYLGRWQVSADNATVYWGSSSFETAFTGSHIYLEFAEDKTYSFIASIDGGQWVPYENVSGKVNLTPTPLSSTGTHTLRVITPVNRAGAGGTLMPPFILKNLIIDETGSVVPVPTPAKKIIEIVGDSISDGWYGVRAPGAAVYQLGMVDVNIAYAGITLCDVPNWTGTSTGMMTQYFKQTNDLSDANAPEYAFDAYTPDAIMINLGTNDYDRGVSEADFKAAYKTFIQKVRLKNPNAAIYAVRPFGGFAMVDGVETFVSFMETPIKTAVQELKQEGMKNLYYIDTSNWLNASNAKTYLADTVHPNNDGITYLAAKLKAAIETIQNGGQTVYPKIDLSGYVEGMTSPSAFPQSVISSNASCELWGLGIASLIDGSRFGNRYIGADGGVAPETFNNTWIKIELQKNYTINKLGFAAWGNNSGQGLPKDFTIETSKDGTVWQTVLTKTNLKNNESDPESNWYEFGFEETEARYVRLNVTAIVEDGDVARSVILNEIEIYGEEVKEESPELPAGTKISVENKYVTVSDSYEKDGFGKANLFDGNTNTAFAAIKVENAPGKLIDEWIKLDLQNTYSVNKIRLASRANNSLGGFPTDFDILVSSNGTDWTKVKTVNEVNVNQAEDQCWYSFTFDAVNARYVRINIRDIGGVGDPGIGYGVTLREFEVYQTSGSKIDLSDFVKDIATWKASEGINVPWASLYQQSVATASKSYELWGWGIAGLIDGDITSNALFACVPSNDNLLPVQPSTNAQISVDLRAAYSLDKIRLASLVSGSLAGFAKDFKVQVSLDGLEWTTALNKSNITLSDADAQDPQWYSFAIAPTTPVRYVRILISKTGAITNETLGWCASLSEIEIYGTIDESVVIKPDDYMKIDLSKALIRASNSYNMWGHGTTNLYNGSTTNNLFIATSVEDADYYAKFKDTQAFENVTDEYLKIRLNGIYTIDTMRFQPWWTGSGQGVPKNYTLYGSLDGESWTVILDVDDQQVVTSEWYTLNFEPVKARYLKIQFNSVIEPCDLGYVAAMKELEFYGILDTLDIVDDDVEMPPFGELPDDTDNSDSEVDSPNTGSSSLVILTFAFVTTTLTLIVFVRRRRIH